MVRLFKLAELQANVQERRKALAEQGVVLPTDEELRNKGGRRTDAKMQLLERMTDKAKLAGVTPGKRYI